MSILKVQCTIGRDSAVPADAITNTWSFHTTASPEAPADIDAIITALQTFYQAIDGVLFAAETANLLNYKVYRLSDPKPRAPVREGSFALVPSVSVGIPEEVAIVLSFQGAKQSGLPQARRRGRVYIGPLPTGSTIFATVNNRIRVVAGARDVLKNAAEALLLASDAAANWTWVVVSSVGGDNVFLETPVTNGWVDDAFDIQRRRGPAPTARTTFGVL